MKIQMLLVLSSTLFIALSSSAHSSFVGEYTQEVYVYQWGLSAQECKDLGGQLGNQGCGIASESSIRIATPQKGELGYYVDLHALNSGGSSCSIDGMAQPANAIEDQKPLLVLSVASDFLVEKPLNCDVYIEKNSDGSLSAQGYGHCLEFCGAGADIKISRAQ